MPNGTGGFAHLLINNTGRLFIKWINMYGFMKNPIVEKII